MTPNQRPRLLFYCLSLVGIGHLTASLHVIRELLNHSDVDLIYSGHQIDLHLQHPGFRPIILPAILINDKTGELYDPSRCKTIEQLWSERNDSIQQFLSNDYNAIIVEFFPFGRRRFKKEIHKLFQTVQDKSGNIPIFCFVREVLVPESLDSEQRMVQLLNDFIHTVFVRGDPKVISFDDTFSLTPQIAGKLFYTGYLGSRLPAQPPIRTKQILVSQGGGSIGRDLLEAAIRTAPLLTEFDFFIATGTKTSAGDFAHLHDLVSSPNVRIVPFLTNYKEQLLKSCLSISLGGDNTLTDVISTQTPGLAFPYPGNSEQEVRINKLVGKGLIQPLSMNDLTPEKFRKKILAALGAPYPQISIQMDGAKAMSEKIKSILSDSSC